MQHDANPHSTRAAWIGAALWFVFAFLLLLFLRHNAWPLTGSDPYYQLRFASHVAEHGLGTHELPWARFSVLHDQWGDKEFLFRLFLLPFAAFHDPIAGGKVALTALNALQAGLVALLGCLWFGRKGLLLPVAVLASNVGIFQRLDLLRPHNLSLVFLLLAAWCIDRHAHRRLGVVAALYALAYTAAHSLILLCAGIFLLLALFRKERPWGLLVYPVLGFVVGHLLHPAFPHNVSLWKLTNIDFYTQSNVPGLGMEIFPVTTAQFLLSSSMGLLLLTGALLTTRPWTGASPISRRELVLGSLALVFVCMTLLAFRFVEYAAPFAALYGFALYDRLSRNPTHDNLQKKHRRIVMSALLAFTFLTSLALAHVLGIFASGSRYFPTPAEAQGFRDALPAGAKVAARWDSTSLYCFAAPHALYLNVVDPIYMHAFDPERSRLAWDLFQGRAVDPVALLEGPLDSDYVALHKQSTSLLDKQLRSHPRIKVVLDGSSHAVFMVKERMD